MKIIKVAQSSLTLYHGTSDKNSEKIKVEGLKHNASLGPGWFMLADNFEDAKFHSSSGNGNPVVIEFKIPDEKDEFNLNEFVWNPTKAMSGIWYSLRKDIPGSFITNITEV